MFFMGEVNIVGLRGREVPSRKVGDESCPHL